MPIIDMTQKVLDACVLRRQVTRLVGPGECFYLGRRGPSPPACLPLPPTLVVSPCKQLIRRGQLVGRRHVAAGGKISRDLAVPPLEPRCGSSVGQPGAACGEPVVV